MSEAGWRDDPTMFSTRAAERNRNGLGMRTLRPGLAGEMPCNLLEVPVVNSGIGVVHKSFFRDSGKGHDTEVWILKKLAQAFRLFPETRLYNLVDRLRATKDRDPRGSGGVQTQSVNPVYALQIMARIERSLQVDCIATDMVKAYSFG